MSQPGHSRGSRQLKRWRVETIKQNLGRTSAQLGLDCGRYGSWESGKARPGLRWAIDLERETDGEVPTESWFAADPGELVDDEGGDVQEARAS